MSDLRQTRMHADAVRLLVVAGLLCYAARPAFTQVPLPDGMRAEFAAYDTTAAMLRPSVAGDPRARISFDTDKRKLELEWIFGIPGTETGLGTLDNGWRRDNLTLGYEPTALCQQEGATSTFFVAGWVERLGLTMVERFEVTNMAVATTVTPGAEPVATLALTYEREIILSRADIGPVRALAYHHSQERLWILEDGEPVRLLSMDVGTSTVTEIANSGEISELAQMHSALEVFVPASSPTGGGFYVILRPERAWEFIDEVDPSSQVFLTRDLGFDGTLDESAVKTWAQVESQVDLAGADWTYH